MEQIINKFNKDTQINVKFLIFDIYNQFVKETAPELDIDVALWKFVKYAMNALNNNKN